MAEKRSTILCKYGASCRRPDCYFAHPEGKEARSNAVICKFGKKCWRENCYFVHPDGKNPPSQYDVNPTETSTEGLSESDTLDDSDSYVCMLGAACDNFDCRDIHPEERPACCDMGLKCTLNDCPMLHPMASLSPCPNAEMCRDIVCHYHHPPNRPKCCRYTDSCYDYNCVYLHSSKRQACSAGRFCENIDCLLNHPPSRENLICSLRNQCFNTACDKRHPPGHNVCPLLETCFDVRCSLSHPPTRPKICQTVNCTNIDCEHLHFNDWNPDGTLLGVTYLKSLATRQQERITAALPIYSSHDEFISRLKREKVLVVTAETGSGKTTQLPQYCAEAFGGLIICTQPRVIAAISVAQRMSLEFDGTSAGENVGYTVGGGNSVKGQRIMLMTDSSLVHMAQEDANLMKVSVLIIDEAHERSLNTDLVLGIAKLVRKNRKEDFHVVVASATIDPKPFLDFFFSESSVSQPLIVPGRTFPVEVEYVDDIDEDDDLLKSGYLISKVIKSLKIHQEGHCLVFLPGSGEVDNALCQFSNEANPEWIGLPLYGNLPPEEQNRVLNFDDCKGTLRMVIFCTNVAETSLTVPNVRLVIDTGLAKEARYDPKRHMTVLELVYISRSSADQRKGRAGRTAPGHCIRLYKQEWLTRKHITPEILRSSLDLVVLQLCQIGYNPQKFPFIDPPRGDLIDSSLQTLKSFDCLDTECNITERGKFFNRLPFDPRLSHFVATAQEQYGQGKVASSIAAILSAPGSLFFMAGGKAGRYEVKKRMADEAAKYESDLLYLLSVYYSWVQAGSAIDKATSICNGCSRKIPFHLMKRNNGCRSCRTRHSNTQGLNNKILEIIHKNDASVMAILQNRRVSLNELSNDSDVDNLEILGRCLLGAFQDQLGHMVLPCNPKAGAYLVFSSMKAHLSHSTALAIARAKTGAPPYFVAMSITKIPNGMTIADRAHPIKEVWLTQLQLEQISKHSLQMSICYCRENLSKRFLKHLQTQISSLEIMEEKKHLVEFISCYYDSEKNAICVSAPQDIASDVSIYASKIIEMKLKVEREYEQVVLIGEGSGYATVIGGLRVNVLEQIGNALKVKYFNPPVKSNDELKSWICAKANISDHTIKWHRYYPLQHKEGSIPGEPYAIAVFYDELSAMKASKINTQQSCIAATQSAITSKDQGQKLILKVKLDESIARCQLEHLLPKPISIATVYPPTFSLRLRNIPPHAMSETIIVEYLQSCMDNDNEFANPKISITGDQAFVSLPNATSQHAYLRACINIKQSSLGQIRFTKQITTKRGYQRSIPVALETEIIQYPITLSLLFANTQDAELFMTNNGHISLWPEGKLYAEAVVHVQHPELYDVQSLASSVAKKFAVQFSISKTKKLMKFNGKSPKQVTLCAQAVQSYLNPLKIHLGERKQQVLVTELHSNGCLFQDANDCGVCVEPRVSNTGEVFGLTIYGPQSNQGQFMRKIGTYSNAFEGRYDYVKYDSTTASMFQMPCAGSKRLQALQEGTSSAKIVFLKSLDGIEIVINPDIPLRERENIFKYCKEGIQKIVLDLCGDDRKIVDQSCVKCKVREGWQFCICGHSCCRNCKKILCDEFIKAPTPQGICCPICSELISIKDIRNGVPAHTFDEACITSAKLFIKTQPHHPLIFCPQKNCNNLLPQGMDYGECNSCHSYVCVKCSTVDNPLHSGKSCVDFHRLEKKSQKRGLCFESLLGSAKAFVQQNWSFILGEPKHIDENPGIKLGCPAMVRYCQAITSKLAGGGAFPPTLFAWHGTSSDPAIQSICHNGFDPTRRSGQMHGIGEYFGQSAEVSSSYAGSTSRMIVAQLLQVEQTSTHGNFCYVVNNPIDWSLSYCLPVLVVTYGLGLPPLVFNCNFPPQRLPFHLFGSCDPSDEDTEME